MSKHVDFGETTNRRRTHTNHSRDNLGIATLLLRYRLVRTDQEANQLSKLIMLGIVLVSILTMLALWFWNSSSSSIPEDAYFDPAIHNADDEPI